ncbi:MAG TPA: alginate export family protein [Planctomycetota bacterium]|nr:alginate export family protein [Planctomycetota bacterium]
MSGRSIVLHAAWAATLAALGPDLRAGETGPGFQWPAFQDIRYQEDWSALSRRPAGAPSDWSAPLKYVPLNRDGSWWASFGGQVRERYERWRDFGFLKDGGNDDYLQSRFRLHGDFHFTQAFRLFVEMKSSHTSDRDLPGGRRTLDCDRADVQNAFAEFNAFPSETAKVTFRVGRQELSLGKQRFVSPLDWGNTRRTFDAVSAILQFPTWTVTTFWGRVVLVDRFHRNRYDHNSEVYGVYATHRVNRDLTWDLYGLGFRNQAAAFNGTTGAERRWTAGTRLGGKIGGTGLDFDVEGAGQFGTIGGQDIRAWMFASQLGYTIAGAAASPRLFLGFDYASGDHRPGGDVGSFNQLYPLGHAYLGYVDTIGRQNIVDLSTGIELKPVKQLLVKLDGHHFWRADNRDAVYNAGGAVARAGGLGTSRNIGSEVDLFLRYQLDRHQTVMGGFSHFFPGTFLKQSGAHEDIDFSCLIWQFTF